MVAFYTVPLVFYTMHRRWTTKRPVSDDTWCADVWGLLRRLPLLRGGAPALLLLPCLPACCRRQPVPVPAAPRRPHRPLEGEEELQLAEVDLEAGGSGELEGGKDVSRGCCCC